MSAAATAPTNQPSRVGRLLDLVRKLIDYGRELAATLPLRAATDLASITRCFGTSDIALILASITRGLLRANALEARLLKNAAHLDAKPNPRAAPAQPKSCAARPAAQRNAAADANLAELPTPEQIAAWVGRRPIGAVLAEICRELGILPGHRLWRELRLEIIREGSNFTRLAIDMIRRVSPILLQRRPAAATPVPSPAATGPP